MIGLLWRLSKGHRLHPWTSPYLRWRIETYWGLHADRIATGEFLRFVWERKAELFRFFRWADEMEKARKSPSTRQMNEQGV